MLNAIFLQHLLLSVVVTGAAGMNGQAFPRLFSLSLGKTERSDGESLYESAIDSGGSSALSFLGQNEPWLLAKAVYVCVWVLYVCG